VMVCAECTLCSNEHCVAPLRLSELKLNGCDDFVRKPFVCSRGLNNKKCLRPIGVKMVLVLPHQICKIRFAIETECYNCEKKHPSLEPFQVSSSQLGKWHKLDAIPCCSAPKIKLRRMIGLVSTEKDTDSVCKEGDCGICFEPCSFSAVTQSLECVRCEMHYHEGCYNSYLARLRKLTDTPECLYCFTKLEGLKLSPEKLNRTLVYYGRQTDFLQLLTSAYSAEIYKLKSKNKKSTRNSVTTYLHFPDHEAAETVLKLATQHISSHGWPQRIQWSDNYLRSERKFSHKPGKS